MTGFSVAGGRLRPEAKHRDDLPGRHCAICGRVGGGGFRIALRHLGIDGDKAHPNCIAKERARIAAAAANPTG